jgi:two-component system OmpR family response regulator
VIRPVDQDRRSVCSSVPGRILVIDDCGDFRRLASLALRAWGHTGDTAADGRLGVELALGARYDLVLVDYDMPEVDGIEVLRRLRAGGFPGLICAVTASSMHTRAGFLQFGFDEHLDKSEFVPRGRAVVAELLERASATAVDARLDATGNAAP